MNFVNPAALAFAGLLIPVVALYVLKIRLRRVPVSTLIFWRQVFEEKKPRSLWQRLRHWVSLLLQLAFLTLLVLALGDPLFRWQQARARRIVLVLDNSASMNAADAGATRLDAAKAEARRVVDGLRLGDELAMVSGGTPPQVFCGLTDHQRTLREAIDAVPPTDAPTQVTEAVALARRLLSDPDKTRKLVVLSDGCFPGADALAKQPDVEFTAFGSKVANVGITRLQARRSLLDPLGYEILAEVRNASDSPVVCRLEVDLNEDPVDVVPLSLKPGEAVTQVFEKTSADGGTLRARISRVDALSADNQAFALLPRRDRQPLALMTAGDLFLEKVFEAMPLVDLAVVKTPPEQPLPSPPKLPAGVALTPITVYHRRTPAELPPGPVVIIEPVDSSPFWQVGETLLNPVVAKQDKDSPLMAHVRLDRVLMPEARKLAPVGPAKVQVLAESGAGDPLFLVIDRGEGKGKIVVLTVNLDKSDLPLQTAFPILMTNTLGWFAGGKGELREALGTGAAAEIVLPAEALKAGPDGARPALRLRSPDGRERALHVAAGATRAIVGPLDKAGIWTVLAGPSTGKVDENVKTRLVMELACNLASPAESDLRPAEGLPKRAPGLASSLGSRPAWYYVVACAWLLTCWEWFLYQRRWID